jgi:1,4-dihydroxy-2-naphthoate octaprenyltransferase
VPPHTLSDDAFTGFVDCLLQVGALATELLAINNVRDMCTDVRVRKYAQDVYCIHGVEATRVVEGPSGLRRTTPAQVGKRTLPVMFGLGFGRVEIAGLSAVAYLAGGFWCVPALQRLSG